MSSEFPEGYQQRVSWYESHAGHINRYLKGGLVGDADVCRSRTGGSSF